MICDKCKNMICMQAFTTTTCKRCGIKITTGHIPGYIVCKECSEYLKVCEQCGQEIKDNAKNLQD